MLVKKNKCAIFFVKVTGNCFSLKAYKNRSWVTFELPNLALHNITKIHSIKNRNKLIDLSTYLEYDIIGQRYNELKTANNAADITKITNKHLPSYLIDNTIILISFISKNDFQKFL